MTARLFPDDPDETRIEILKATYAALCEHGYADLTIERIGQHFPKSTSLVYHHYEGKDDLLLDFLSYLLEDAETSLGTDETADADERLRTIFDRTLSGSETPEEAAFQQAMAWMRAQATTDEEYRDHFTQHDRFFRDRLADIIRDGIEAGTFREVDPEQAATMLHTVLSGAMAEQVTSDLDLSTMRSEVDAYIEERLLPAGR
ncbi:MULTISPECIES: TetR family transcriptional regulator C-terminal domain-containing protein [unclassified Halorhabdus]|uniref:TetR/AcrR family transcriptional regulator n=1 Tax=unclassified Halorhabdus TaxID=2621901 RepID=UPI0023DC22BE|nr:MULTISPECIES: TetR family transcriptional regulator C-terminal domain-containing protein [unclassified Halorhabdus]WEL17270.1 Transcriptional regulator, TetR/AcrR family [Halorhabdus sp. SVX81]WEL21152.1 Transcriptional regulator, TetR/AcrR family [Halorhabdus sp. BNX81]